MITKTYYDVHDLIKLISKTREGKLELHMHNGKEYITVANFTPTGDEEAPYTMDAITVDGDVLIPATPERTDAVYRAVWKKISSGEWAESEA